MSPDYPLACYQISGEFVTIHAGAAAGVYALRTMAFESVERMIRGRRPFSDSRTYIIIFHISGDVPAESRISCLKDADHLVGVIIINSIPCA
jgi:hypothetical protein